MTRPPPRSTLFPYTTLFRSIELRVATIPTNSGLEDVVLRLLASARPIPVDMLGLADASLKALIDRKSTRLNSSHMSISYAVFCLKKKKKKKQIVNTLKPKRH